MKPTVLLLVLLYAELSSCTPTPVDEEEDNHTGDVHIDAGVEMFDELRGLIVESRDAILVHIDEKIDELKQDIILNDDNEFVISKEPYESLPEEDVCNPPGEDLVPVCGEFGECIPSEDGSTFTCLCEHGYMGETCQLLDHCAEITCQNGGKCVNNKEGFECDCQASWYGEHCELAVE